MYKDGEFKRNLLFKKYFDFFGGYISEFFKQGYLYFGIGAMQLIGE